MQRKGRAWIVDQRKTIFLSNFLVNAVLSVCAGLAVSEAVFPLSKRREAQRTQWKQKLPVPKVSAPDGKDYVYSCHGRQPPTLSIYGPCSAVESGANCYSRVQLLRSFSFLYTCSRQIDRHREEERD